MLLCTIIKHMFEMLIDELAAMSSPELDDVIADAELIKRQAEARLAAAVAVVSERASYNNHGYVSIRSYVKGQLNCSGPTANKIRRRADIVKHHARVGTALFHGRIGIEQVDLLAKAQSHAVAGERFAEFAPQLLDHAEHLEVGQFDTTIAHFINRADPDGSFDDQKFREDERSASVAVINGAVDIHASGGAPLAANEMKAIFEAAVEAEFDKDCEARRAEHGDGALAVPLPRTSRQRKFDAFHTIFMTSVAAPADGKTPEPLVNIVIDHASASTALMAHGLVATADVLAAVDQGDDDLPSRQCSINGTPVHPDVALQAMIAGRVRRAIVDSQGVTIDLGRTQRLFTGKAREAAQLLAVTCTHRGCDIPARFCDIDHRAEWAGDGGSTNQDNAMPLCGHHDRWKHANKVRSRRAANGRIYLIRPDGSTIKPVGETEPEWAEPEPVESSPPTPRIAPDRSEPTEADPWARFGRALNAAELTARRFPPDHGWDVRVIDFDAIARRRT